MPRHVAVIMDGNGRWAESKGLTRSQGHKAGTDTAKAVVRACRERGIEVLTLYTFSRENWARPKDEVAFLFDLLSGFLKREIKDLIEQDIRLNVLGELGELPLATRTVVRHTMEKTAQCGSMIVNLALNYGGRDEIVRACQALVREGLAPQDVTEEALAQRLYTGGQPDPDLIIRTSGELRLSNFLLFQAAYSEFYFTDTLWPDFGPEELDKALAQFGGRQRRFGKTATQARTGNGKPGGEAADA